MITLGTTAGVAAFSMAGKEKAKEQGPPINATSKEEEQFIQYVRASQNLKGVQVSENDTDWLIREFIKAANEEGEKAKH